MWDCFRLTAADHDLPQAVTEAWFCQLQIISAAIMSFRMLGAFQRVHKDYVENNKNSDNDWFRLESNKEGTRWFGKCWYIHDFLKYEFDIEFEIPITYPSTAPEIAVPELDGKTAKMYRGGKICLTDHFKPLWARNVPKFGLAHLMALGLGPWLAVEVPDLIQKGVIQHKEKCNQ
ncbi:Ubiquitin-fold modifier-conjugating enzyme 1 [Apodemus speciosus]|uniref:Ubiquitin-fold modifier-conjugating enzyme 1 n=1 Tax=Apodemus speciosus TaxID=105296 RepID=A0ABQ0EFZ5_APOSI